jgi:hypothetical protein
MSDLIVVGYNDEHQAEDVRQKLIKMQHEYLVDLEDAVVAVRGKDGSVKLAARPKVRPPRGLPHSPPAGTAARPTVKHSKNI